MMLAKEVAEYTRTDVQTIYRKAKSGEIPCYRIGRAIRFKLDEVEMAMKEEKNAKKGRTRSRSHLAG
ncbi:MAG: helix-turn-helix domain-containing protein [Clostridiales bacterium]|nr:helix-turn-helix domain-containing protein [Clostridiales bacterium]